MSLTKLLIVITVVAVPVALVKAAQALADWRTRNAGRDLLAKLTGGRS